MSPKRVFREVIPEHENYRGLLWKLVKMVIYDIITIFPQMFAGVFEYGIVKKAIGNNIVSIHIHDLRDFATDKHRTVDDYPYGGGGGMVLKVEPIYRAVEFVKSQNRGKGCSHVIYLTPQGEVLTQELVSELSGLKHIIFICGRYEGVDERVREMLVDREISIGDYILSGGEIPVMVLIDAMVRLIPGVVKNKLSIQNESFVNFCLDYPVYTRPRFFSGCRVPDVLLSGNHKLISQWRKKKAYERTVKKRPDLIKP